MMARPPVRRRCRAAESAEGIGKPPRPDQAGCRECYVLRSYVGRSSRGIAPSGLRRPNDPPLLILVSLADGPKHGHALAKDIEDFAGVKLGPGAL